MRPERIQCTRRAKWKTPGVVYVGRHVDRTGAQTWYGRWGNPFVIKKTSDGMYGVYYEARLLVRWDTARLAAAEAVDRYEGAIRESLPRFPLLPEIVARLGGCDLACWCPIGEPCHGDVLLALANPRSA